jgi:hypothetical protein
MRPLLATLLLAALALSGCDDDRPSEPAGAPGPSVSTPSSPPTSEPTRPALDACTVLGASDVGHVLGTEVERVVAEGGCRFANPDQPAAASLGISQGELRALGGIAGAKAGIRAVVDGPVEDVPGVGDGAFVVVGSAFGADSPTAGGAVALGTSLVQITVIPAPETTGKELQATTVQLLTLIADKAGR